MEDLTIEEMNELLEAVNFYIINHDRPRPEWIEPPDGVYTIDLMPLKEIRAKLISDIASIELLENEDKLIWE